MDTEKLSPITIKRINGDIRIFQKDPPPHIKIWHNPQNILEIFFLYIGEKDTPYEGGHYICKLIHNPLYPRKAPDYFVLTPNGRFEINKKICVTTSAFHNDEWAPGAWNLRGLLDGFISIWTSEIPNDTHGISHMVFDKNTVEKFRNESIKYNVDKYNDIYSKFNL